MLSFSIVLPRMVGERGALAETYVGDGGTGALIFFRLHNAFLELTGSVTRQTNGIPEGKDSIP